MGWEKRGAHQYYYRKERDGLRVKSVYVGRGELANMTSQNRVNLANPVSNLNAASLDQNTGQIINPGDFGRITSTSNNPRLIQFAAKFNF